MMSSDGSAAFLGDAPEADDDDGVVEAHHEGGSSSISHSNNDSSNSNSSGPYSSLGKPPSRSRLGGVGGKALFASVAGLGSRSRRGKAVGYAEVGGADDGDDEDGGGVGGRDNGAIYDDDDEGDAGAIHVHGHGGDDNEGEKEAALEDSTIRGTYFGAAIATPPQPRSATTSSTSTSGGVLYGGSGLYDYGDYAAGDDDEAMDVTSASYAPDDTFEYISSGMHGHRGGARRTRTPAVPTATEAASSSSNGQIANKATWLSCYLNVTNTIVGSGMLGLPYAFAHTGWALGLLMLIAAALLSILGLRLLSLAAAHTPRPASFHGAASAALPELAASLIDVAVAIKCFGVATSYLIIVSDMMPDVMIHAGAPLFLTNPVVWVTLAMAIVSPLSVPRSLDALKHTSGAALVFVLMCVALIVTYSTGAVDPCASHDGGSNEGVAIEDACVGPSHALYPESTSSGDGRGLMGVIRVMPIFVFSFTCHQNAFTVVNELRDATLVRVNSVFRWAVGSAFAVYVVIAMCGYSTFGDLVQSDILLNYPRNTYTTGCRLLIALLVLSSYPLQCNPARTSILNLIGALADADDRSRLLCGRGGRSTSESSDTISSSSSDEENGSETRVINFAPASDGAGYRTPLRIDNSNSSSSSSIYSSSGGNTDARGILTSSPLDSPSSSLGLISIDSNSSVGGNNGGAMVSSGVVDADTLQSRYNKTTFFFLLLSYLCALAVSDISSVLAVVGASGSTLVCYILPGGIYVAIYHRQRGWHSAQYLRDLWARWGIFSNGSSSAGGDGGSDSSTKGGGSSSGRYLLPDVSVTMDSTNSSGIQLVSRHGAASASPDRTEHEMDAEAATAGRVSVHLGTQTPAPSTTTAATTAVATGARATRGVSKDYVGAVGLLLLGIAIMPLCLAAIALNH